jgi:hypothetical protein
MCPSKDAQQPQTLGEGPSPLENDCQSFAMAHGIPWQSPIGILRLSPGEVRGILRGICPRWIRTLCESTGVTEDQFDPKDASYLAGCRQTGVLYLSSV